MDAVFSILESHWPLVVLVAAGLAKVLNAITPHYAEREGVTRALLIIVDVLDVIKLSRGPRPPLVLLLVVGLAGCATGLAAVEKALPIAAEGVHVAASAGHQALGLICAESAARCKAKGITVAADCPKWVQCDQVRIALEEVARGMEYDIAGVRQKIGAFHRVREAIEAMKGDR